MSSGGVYLLMYLLIIHLLFLASVKTFACSFKVGFL